MKNTSDLFNEIIPLGRLIYMVNQKKDRLLNDYLSPLDITASQFKVLCSIRCAVCITPVELKKVLSVDLGALTRMLDRLACKGDGTLMLELFRWEYIEESLPFVFNCLRGNTF